MLKRLFFINDLVNEVNMPSVFVLQHFWASYFGQGGLINQVAHEHFNKS
jgi:hypothetical protein